MKEVLEKRIEMAKEYLYSFQENENSDVCYGIDTHTKEVLLSIFRGDKDDEICKIVCGINELLEELKHNQNINFTQGLENTVDVGYIIERIEGVFNGE